MTTIPDLKTPRHERRVVLFRIVAGLIAIGLFAMDGISVLAPWIDLPSHRDLAYPSAIQRWYEARWSAYAGILLTGCLLALLQSGPRPLLLQFLVLAGAILGAISLPFEPLIGITRIVAIALLVAIFPDRGSLARFSRPDRVSRPLLALSLVTGALLALNAWHSIQPDLGGAYGYDRYSSEAVVLAAALALAGLLAATKRPGWQALALLAGAALIYLGLVAAKLLEPTGHWSGVYAALATLSGWAFVGATLWEARRERKNSADWSNATSLIPK
ncbi:MAG TPA: hypothetical protein VKE41_08340 [Roseiflexaceae bacterium]|nr:hypothetical protein [Roseiflexaceae bacterium]